MAHVDSARCDRLRPDLSGFVDLTLPPKRFERVGYHVAGCAACRAEVADLRRIRSTLRADSALCPPPRETLAEQLQSIAGEGCHQPLYLCSGSTAVLPSRRAWRQRRLWRGGIVGIAAVASLVVLVLLLAPEPPKVTSAVGTAQEQYSLAISAIHVNEALGAVLLAHGRGAAPGEPVEQSARAGLVGRPTPVTREEAAHLLDVGRNGGLTFSGLQRVWVTDGRGAFHASDVRLDQVADHGTSVVVLDGLGNRYLSWFVPRASCCGGATPEGWSFVRYDGLDQVAGRWASILEARDESGARVGRWWLDSDNGMVVWSERYGPDGSPTLISGFVALRLGEATIDDRADSELVVMDPVSSSGTRDWCVGIARCPLELAGLPLVAHASSHAAGRTLMRLVYSDGIRSLSVCWSDGVLDAGGATRLSVVDPGQPAVEVWQAGDGVVSVATNGGPALLTRATGELPTEQAYQSSVWDRLARGLRRVSGIQ